MSIEHPIYTQGMHVSFHDSEATVSDGKSGVCTGMVNGEPIRDDDGAITHVPVWAERDNGRESTTIFVSIHNMLGEVKK